MIVEHAYAKLNLALDVVGKRNDGYHDLQMIVIPLQLSDLLSFELSDKVELESNIEIENNAIIQTVQYIKKMFHVKKGVRIVLEKHIPIGSGLGGESADIAATIRGLNQLWDLQLKKEDLEKIALDLGSDTLFCLYNKTALVTGRGEHLEFLENPPIKDIYLCISEHPISTHESFKNYVHKRHKKSFHSLVNDYKNKQFKSFFKTSYNDLLETAFLLDKTLENTYKALVKSYKNAYMTGSGSTLFITDFSSKSVNLEEIKTISNRNVIKTALFI